MGETAGKIRVIVAKAGLDGHDRGAKVVARALRDAGVEVIYTGLHQTPEQIVAAAIQEDVDAVGLSVLSGAHMTLFPRVVELLKEQNASDIVVFGGGIIPDADIAELTTLGVAKIFTPGATMTDIVAWVNETLAPHRVALRGRVFSCGRVCAAIGGESFHRSKPSKIFGQGMRNAARQMGFVGRRSPRGDG